MTPRERSATWEVAYQDAGFSLGEKRGLPFGSLLCYTIGGAAIWQSRSFVFENWLCVLVKIMMRRMTGMTRVISAVEMKIRGVTAEEIFLWNRVSAVTSALRGITAEEKYVRRLRAGYSYSLWL